ncbi:MAG: hypothetical protein KDK97_18405 [Verrucomicrobiales bacterium]|nr:hypothetical protein [Verrucomicrobiales bacterium]MCP5558092.1 hypothetical protein [Verrucomicrobiaceae bacterium]
MNSNPTQPKATMTWLIFALMTVLFWGVYGVILHMGRGAMPGVNPPGPEMQHAGLKAFLLVCVAYAVIGGIAAWVLKARGSDWSFSTGGITISFIAGFAGAAGALTLVLALGAAALPAIKGGGGYGAAAAAAVMPIVFGGAPIVNSIVAMLLHKPDGGLKSIPLPFFIGIILAATGAVMVAKFAPSNAGGGAKHAPAPAATTAPTGEPPATH